MKSKYKILSLVLLLAFASCSFTSKTSGDPEKDKLLVQVITFVLEQGHFSPLEFNDDFSEELFNDYIGVLDPVKRYFYQSDIEEFEKYKYLLDDQLKASEITFFNVVNERMLQRFDEAKIIYKELLSIPFYYTIDEEFDTDYKFKPYPDSKKEMIERWRIQLKFTSLSNYDDILTEEEQKKEKDSTYEMKSFEQIEKEAREATLKSLDVYFEDYIDDQQREDWFAIYVNTIVEEFDPHTYYLAPKGKEDFDQRMSGKLEGIGARLQKRMDYIKVVELISGGPAWRGKELEVEDIILKVKQEKEKHPVDIVGMRINDAIELIKGPKGTKVTLTVKKVDGTIRDITITRDVVELEETYAKSSIVEKDGKRFGVINLPAFYVDFQDYKNVNAAKDVRTEIERLKADGMEGLVLDLRNNGGGSLPAVVEMAGLFIKNGPIVQVRSSDKSKDVLRDKDESIVWTGPLVILVNEVSASASEIMAAAMQDYKRAVIIGSKQTYGKGTVQNVINLNNVIRNGDGDDLGALALTTQKYYRINGGSVQLEGVKSDVVVPSRFSFIDFGEKDKDNPLPYDEIDAADYKPWENYFDYKAAIQKSEARMRNSDQLKLIEENAKWVKSKMDETVFSLNYEKYKTQINKNDEEAKRFEILAEYETNLIFGAHSFEKALFEKDATNLKQKREVWYESLSKDIYIEEALNVLEDLKTPSQTKEVASTVKK